MPLQYCNGIFIPLNWNCFNLCSYLKNNDVVEAILSVSNLFSIFCGCYAELQNKK